jgi:hypothetical protein
MAGSSAPRAIRSEPIGLWRVIPHAEEKSLAPKAAEADVQHTGQTRAPELTREIADGNATAGLWPGRAAANEIAGQCDRAERADAQRQGAMREVACKRARKAA